MNFRPWQDLGRSGLLPFERSRVRGREADSLILKMLAEQAGLRAAELRERVVILARAGLPMPNQVENAHSPVAFSTSSAARAVSAFTRSSNLLKRSSCVWPFQ